MFLLAAVLNLNIIQLILQFLCFVFASVPHFKFCRIVMKALIESFPLVLQKAPQRPLK